MVGSPGGDSSVSGPCTLLINCLLDIQGKPGKQGGDPEMPLSTLPTLNPSDPMKSVNVQFVISDHI